MERVYFSINETGAKTANDMMSFSEYKTGARLLVTRRRSIRHTSWQRR